MNKLYSLFLYRRTPDSGNYYLKKRTPVSLGQREQEILQALFGGASDDRMAFIACVLCPLVLSTPFAEDILKLDPVNTYTYPKRNEEATKPAVTDQLMYDVVTTPELMKKIAKQLDKDIRDRLQVPTWLEFMGAVSLQLLRSNEQ